MYISSLEIENFRNYSCQKIELSPYTNVFYGNNAQGKTNILEAVYLFSHGRSHRARTDNELIKFGESFYDLNLLFSDKQRDYKARIRFLNNGKKQIKINNVPITKLSMLMSYLNVVMFSPEDLELIKGGPSEKRHFIDEAISQLYPKYLSNLISYHKTLAQKNSLLKNLKFSDKKSDAMLSVWNEQLAEFGCGIYISRRDFLNSLSQFASAIHSDISGEDFKISYAPGIRVNSDEKDLKKEFYEVLEQNQRREIELGSTQVGIQRDDFKIFVNGNEAKFFASQGQQRTCVLTLKMAEAEFINSLRGEYPVLLLDDIMSELDINRRKYLWERIIDKQVLLTCTDVDILNDSSNTKLFNVSGGKIIN